MPKLIFDGSEIEVIPLPFYYVVHYLFFYLKKA